MARRRGGIFDNALCERRLIAADWAIWSAIVVIILFAWSDSEAIRKPLRRYRESPPARRDAVQITPELLHSMPRVTSPQDVGLGNFGDMDHGVAFGTTWSQLGARGTGAR